MKKLTKVGFSALCGSLAAISSANAGELTVTGGAHMTWTSLDKAVTGNPIGIDSSLTFKGSGELDNGWTFSMTIANADKSAYSSTAVNLTMGGLGSLNFNQGDSGNGIDALDDKMPTAWEEPWGAGLSTGVKLVSGVGPSSNVQYTTPTIAGVTLAVAWAPDVGNADNSEKTAGGDRGALGTGYDARININPSLGTEILSGLDIFVGASTVDTMNNSTYEDDIYEGIAGGTFSLGPVSVGYAVSGITTGYREATDANVAAYKGHMYGVAFNVNDNLSVSYGFHDSRKAAYVSGKLQPSKGQRLIEVESYQIAYTMGGVSMRVAEVKGTNLNFTDASDKDATVVSVGLAF
tara:strand:+ start:603 stop:1649 length:1047 start_codon:yes stop_codon:yes gene_type:complete